MLLQIVLLLTSVVIIIYLMNNERGDFEKQTFKESDFLVLNEEDKEKAAAMLHLLVKDMKTLVQHLKQHYNNRLDVQLIIKRFNPKNISEGSPHNRDFTYTENKGEKLVICLRDKETMKIHQKNLLLFPLIHELAHQGVENYTGHGIEFLKVFRFLLKQAEEIGIYKPHDFNNNPTKYCNMTIDAHP